jgi:L-methionine (R)-S-oxide reductase
MWIIQSKYGDSNYFQTLNKELNSLIEGEENLIANLANITSWIYHSYPDLNWCGFYLWNEADKELVLGPFQGLPACIRIKPNRGVCGKAYRTGEVQIINNVHDFKDHIACDSKTNSEVVIPLFSNGKIYGVLDLDSPLENRFPHQDVEELEKIIKPISEKLFKIEGAPK